MRHPNRRQVLTSIVFLTRSQAVLPPSCFGEEGESYFSRKKRKRLIAGYCPLSMNEKYVSKV